MQIFKKKKIVHMRPHTEAPTQIPPTFKHSTSKNHINSYCSTVLKIGYNCLNFFQPWLWFKWDFQKNKKKILDHHGGEGSMISTVNFLITGIWISKYLELILMAVCERRCSLKFLPADVKMEPSRRSSNPVETTAIFITIITVTLAWLA